MLLLPFLKDSWLKFFVYEKQTLNFQGFSGGIIVSGIKK